MADYAYFQCMNEDTDHSEGAGVGLRALRPRGGSLLQLHHIQVRYALLCQDLKDIQRKMHQAVYHYKEIKKMKRGRSGREKFELLSLRKSV